MQETRVGADDARQAAQHESVKSDVESHVNSDIANKAAMHTPSGASRIDAVAGRLRDSAVDETVKSERVLGQARAAARGSQYLDFAFYVVYALLTTRLLLALIAAQSDNGFVRLINTVTGPFYAPFRGIVASPSAEGGFTLVLPIVIALGVYVALHAGINAALRMVGTRKTEI